MKWAFVGPLIGGTFLAMYPMMTTPILIGGSVDSAHLSAEQAGWIGTLSIGAVAAASMLLPSLLRRFPGRLPLFLFAAMLVAGYLGFATSVSFAAFGLFALLGGTGSGGLLAGMAMRIAKAPSPDQVYGVIYAVATGIYAVLLSLLPIVGGRYGASAMFVVLALVALATMPALALLGDDVAEAEHHAAGAPKPWAMIAVVVLVMTVAFPLYGGVYAFSERRAVAIGLEPAAIGAVLGATTLMTVIGALLVAWVGTRPGRTVPTLVTMAVATLAYGLVLGAAGTAPFIAGMLAFGLMQMALNSYFFGLASVLDREGRAAAALQGYSLVPYALGAALFGTLGNDGNLARLALPSVAINIVAALILVPMLIRLDRAARREPA
ncbi:MULTISPECIES: MFS transporter [unclassified Sphingomonas]|uniref:MFS transporter n=1 Tax=unclassified Sphingomonas TaxID=196159 RepID=UPI0006FA61DF|nr:MULTISPECIES: MFS transporter [unclassified Sphingomonas]KQX25167.1 MFS transporter [Sphingomonas sp. Root1294]KQY66184.1 MFS transporter [Sphingomonas sp. Root50]KRB89885.1 MFS transporter [Sphingomonas sp. Root720]